MKISNEIYNRLIARSVTGYPLQSPLNLRGATATPGAEPEKPPPVEPGLSVGINSLFEPTNIHQYSMQLIPEKV